MEKSSKDAPYHLSTRLEPPVLHVNLTGVRTHETMCAATHEIMSIAKRLEVSMGLVDLRGMQGYLAPTDIIFLVDEHFPFLRSKGGLETAAVIDRELHESHQLFAENVAVNRGFDIRMFDDESQALKWLLEHTRG